MALRCKCGQFITKEGRCNRCDINFTHVGITGMGDPEYVGSNGESFCAVNNRLQYIHKEEKKMSGFFSFDEKEAGGFEALEAGEYEAVITKTEVKSSNAGNQMIAVQITIRQDVDQPYGGRKVFDNYVATPNAMFKFHQVAKALNWENGQGADTLDDFAAKIIHKPVLLKIGQPKNDPQRGMQTNIQNYLQSKVDYAGGGSGFDFQSQPDISDEDVPF